MTRPMLAMDTICGLFLRQDVEDFAYQMIRDMHGVAGGKHEGRLLCRVNGAAPARYARSSHIS